MATCKWILNKTVTSDYMNDQMKSWAVLPKIQSPKPRWILSTAAVDNLKLAQFFINQKCAQMSNFGSFYVAN